MVKLSATATLRQRASMLRLQGVEVLDLSAGELDFPTPRHIVDAAVAAAAIPENHHYGPTGGEPQLRQAVATRLSDKSQQPAHPSAVVITHGAKQALFNALAALLTPGDEVIIPAPHWVTFPSSVTLAGGRPVVAHPPPGHLKVSSAALEAARTPATRALIYCSPSNPTGLAYDDDEARDVLGWASHHGIWTIADETYTDLNFKPIPAPAAVIPEIAERLITIGSVSKSFAMTGWRVGWMAGPQAVIDEATAIQSHTTSNVSRIAQAAALAALQGPDVTALFRDELRSRLSICATILRPHGLFDPVPDGAFYVFPDITSFGTDNELAGKLLDHGVLVVPGSAFGAPGRIRISFAVAPGSLRAGLGHIAELFAHPDAKENRGCPS
jgi:aspartate aminotransferase